MPGRPVLLGDIGGTNARFALARGHRIEHRATQGVAEHACAIDAISEFLSALPKRDRPWAAALACAGPVEQGVVAMTNSPWRLDAKEIERRFGFARVHLINDFAAQAWAAPKLGAAGLRAVGGGTPRPECPCVVLGPGTGLGIATYVPPPAGPAAIVGEGGHATMPAADEREAAILAALRTQFGHVSAERVLSGDGLVHLYEALAALENRTVPRRGAAEISARGTPGGTAGDCAHCASALNLFCAMLGTLAGDLALTLGARGGVYISGGIVPRIADHVAASSFRRRFEAKGRLRAYVSAIPTWIVLDPEPAFLGLTHFLAERSRETAP